MVMPKSFQKLADVSKEGTKTLQMQHLHLVSEMQTLLILEGRNDSFRKDSGLLVNMFLYSFLGRLWMNTYICEEKKKKKRRRENTNSSSIPPAKYYITRKSSLHMHQNARFIQV